MPGSDVEFWFARDLQETLGYGRRKKFQTVIKRALEACEIYCGFTKIVTRGKGGYPKFIVDDASSFVAH